MSMVHHETDITRQPGLEMEAAIARGQTLPQRVAFLDRQLRELRYELPGSWVRDVARTI